MRLLPLVRRFALPSLLLLAVGFIVPSARAVADEIAADEIAYSEPTDVEAPPCNRCVDISGCWDCGGWRSFCTTHHGKLRATIVRCDACHYRCTFTGSFFGVVPFRYTATLTVTGYGDGVAYFRSSRSLPLFGGQFTMCGRATACSFTAWYTSPKDRGLFTMSR